MLNSVVWGPKENRKETEKQPIVTFKRNRTEMFKLVEASKFSMSDRFVDYKPHYYLEEKIHKRLIELIEKQQLEDFYVSTIDPSIDENGNICYKWGHKVATDFSYEWWGEQAEEFYPEKNSRLGRDDDFLAFSGSLIKFLVDSGWDTLDAWRAICYDSESHDIVKYSRTIKNSGSGYAICGFYDLVNTYKILARHAKNPDKIILGSGCKFTTPIADIGNVIINPNKPIQRAVGWIIYSK